MTQVNSVVTISKNPYNKMAAYRLFIAYLSDMYDTVWL